MWRVRLKFREKDGTESDWKCDYKGTWTFKSLINHLFDERWLEYLSQNGKEIMAVSVEWVEEETKKGDVV